MIILWSQKITLTVGGAISCWRAVRRERELNTWDFQRITRLSPLELAMGKLFGAPALSYFVTLCLIPPAILSATTTSSISLEFLLQSYVLLFTSTLVIHAFALMISTISDKGGAVSGVVLLLMLQIFPLFGWFVYLGARSSAQNFRNAQALQFYGVAVPSTALWAMLELGFAAWILLAVVRNIKADLEAMQLFTVWEGIGFAVYCNFVWIGFYPWRTTWNATSFGPLLLFSAVLFYLVGIGVLQSRELIRRRLREAGTPRLEDAKLLAPIVSLLIGAAVAQILILMPVKLAQQRLPQTVAASGADQLILVLYFSAWVGRDLFYLQWMKVRPVRTPLRKAFLYLAVFYISTSIVFRSTLTATPFDNSAFGAWLGPFSLVRMFARPQWYMAPGIWTVPFLAQLGAAALFAFLYQQQVAQMAGRPGVPQAQAAD